MELRFRAKGVGLACTFFVPRNVVCSRRKIYARVIFAGGDKNLSSTFFAFTVCTYYGETTHSCQVVSGHIFHAHIALFGLRPPLRGGRPPVALRGPRNMPSGSCFASRKRRPSPNEGRSGTYSNDQYWSVLVRAEVEKCSV